MDDNVKNMLNGLLDGGSEQSGALSEEKMIDTLSGIINARLGISGAQPERTPAFVKIIIDAMQKHGLYADETRDWDAEAMAAASRVYDIGKITLPDSILFKKTELSKPEIEVMRSHPAEGEKILKTVRDADSREKPLLDQAILFCGSHHEHWDGGGYPQGLRGTAIPLQGRVMAVADACKAVVSERLNENGFTHEDVIMMIKAQSGTRFDPAITALFDDGEVVAALVAAAQ